MAPEFHEQFDNLLRRLNERFDSLHDGANKQLFTMARSAGQTTRADRVKGTVKTKHNGEVRGASRLAGEASSREAATSTVVLGAGDDK